MRRHSRSAVAFAVLAACTASTRLPAQVTPNCPMCAEWNAPQAPFRIFGNSYFVGTHGLSAILITSAGGHILIDGGLAESASLIAANIKALGFRLEDVHAIVNSHVHYDHAGGIAELQRLTGATVYASASSLAVLKDGVVGRDDPQFGLAFPIAPVASARIIPANDSVTIGTLAIRALRTAGHTPGGTSWSWVSCDGSRCLSLVYGDSQTAVSADDFRFTRNTTYPGVLADFASGFQLLEQVQCDILITPHPDASALWDRVARRQAGDGDAMRDSTACRRYAASARERLAKRVADERARP